MDDRYEKCELKIYVKKKIKIIKTFIHKFPRPM